MPMAWRGLLASISLALVLSPADASADAQIWTVRPGDALSVLAQRFGVTVEEIKKWNALDSDMIRVGQSLIILEQRYLYSAFDDVEELVGIGVHLPSGRNA